MDNLVRCTTAILRTDRELSKDFREQVAQMLTDMVPPGHVVVPDNDWAFMARVTAMEPQRKKAFYKAAYALMEAFPESQNPSAK